MTWVTKGYACFEVSPEHKRGVRMGRVYHSRDAAQQVVELYQKNAAENVRYELRSIEGDDGAIRSRA